MMRGGRCAPAVYFISFIFANMLYWHTIYYLLERQQIIPCSYIFLIEHNIIHGGGNQFPILNAKTLCLIPLGYNYDRWRPI